MKKTATVLVGLALLFPSFAFAATTDQQAVLLQLISLIKQEIAQLEAQLMNQDTPATDAAAVPALGATEIPAQTATVPLLTDIFEINNGMFRVESNKPLDFASTSFSGQTTLTPIGEVRVSTGWFWPSATVKQVYPSYYYQGALTGQLTGNTITIHDMDGLTLTKTIQ